MMTTPSNGPMRPEPMPHATNSVGEENPVREVVVVDGVPETVEVLRAILEPRGIPVRPLKQKGRLNNQSTASKPSEPSDDQVYVLHLDADRTTTNRPSPDGATPSRAVIVGGRLEVPESNDCESGRVRHLASPFQYADLLTAIDRLMDAA